MALMADKLVSIGQAAALVADGAMIAMGGSLLHRSPNAFARELARQGRRDLSFVKPSSAYDLDLLCLAGCVKTVYAGVVTFEAEFGLAPSFRRAAEAGALQVKEHA